MRHLAQQTVRIGSIETAYRLITTFFRTDFATKRSWILTPQILSFEISEIVISVKSIEKLQISNLSNFFAI